MGGAGRDPTLLEQSRPAASRRLTIVWVALVLAAVSVAGFVMFRPAPKPAPLLSASRRPALAEVINASGRPGLARLVTRMLREQGVDVIFFGSDSKTLDSTVVLVRRGDRATGQEVARLLGRTAVKVEVAIDTLRRLDVTVRLGRDYRLPPGRFPL